METKYREQTYIAGNYATVSVFPVFRGGRRRCRRFRPTSEVQQRLNEQNAKERVGRQLNATFDRNGSFITLTYADAYLPQTREALVRDYENFVRRLKRRLAARNEELIYLAVPHGDVGGTRMHVHAVVNVTLSPEELGKIWKRGIVEISPLVFGRTGLLGLANYMVSGMTWGRVMRSAGVVDPAPRERTGRLSAREVNRIGETWDDVRAYEGLYPGYKVAAVKPFWNWFNQY